MSAQPLPPLPPGSVAVTGASGFIGRYLCAALAAEGVEVIRIGRGAGADRQTDYGAESLEAALAGAGSVVHLAGRRMTREDDPMDLAPFWGPNVAAIAPLVAAARAAGAVRIVLASTIAVYSAASGTPWTEDAPPRPVNAYALSKLMAEAHLEMLTRAAGPAAVALRLAAVYGHGEKGTPALMRFANTLLEGGTITLTGNPDTRIDQLYVRDAVGAIRAALAAEATGVVNVGGGRAWRIDEIARTAAEVMGSPDQLICRPDPETPAFPAAMEIARAREVLGWQPAFDLAAGLADFRATRAAGAGDSAGAMG